MASSGRLVKAARPAVLASRINAPSTLPPPLSLPARSASASGVRHLLGVGRAYLGFYKTGFKQILANRKRAKQVKLLLSATDPAAAKSQPGDTVDHLTGRIVDPPTSPPAPARTEDGEMTRAEFQLLRRHARDMRRLAPFALLLAVFGEWLPLFVAFLTPILPGTVLLPAQVERRRKRRASVSAPVLDLRPSSAGTRLGARSALASIQSQTHAQEETHSEDTRRSLARRLGLAFRPTAAVLPIGVIDARLERHRAYLAHDDALLRRYWPASNRPATAATSAATSKPTAASAETAVSGSGEKDGESAEQIHEDDEQLSDGEVEAALEERGLWQSDLTPEARRQALRDWLDRHRP